MRTSKLQEIRKFVLPWVSLTAFPLLVFVIVRAIEISLKEYPKIDWVGFPVDVYHDAFLPIFSLEVPLFGILIGSVNILLFLAHFVKNKHVRYIMEWGGVHTVIALLSVGIWLTSMFTECTWQGLIDDGSPWGGHSVCWGDYTRPFGTLIWHTFLWILWSIGFVIIWRFIKELMFNENVEQLA